jgi:hypothetical protein
MDSAVTGYLDAPQHEAQRPKLRFRFVCQSRKSDLSTAGSREFAGKFRQVFTRLSRA